MKVSLTDLDSMLYIVAYVHYKAGNRDNVKAVKDNVRRFISSIEKNSGCTHSLRFFQAIGHSNYRKEILPEYKSHRVTPDFITHWKPTIVETFSELGAIAVSSIESDDAINIVGRHIGLNNVVIISSDKDLKQIPCTQYDPFNPHKGAVNDERRWRTVSITEAEKFFWAQVLAGDSTDMPNSLCGIQGVGLKTGLKYVNGITDTFSNVIRDKYTEKYGREDGFERADRTYKMVKLLDGTESYLSDQVQKEIKTILKVYPTKYTEISSISSLFEQNTDIKNLFNT